MAQLFEKFVFGVLAHKAWNFADEESETVIEVTWLQCSQVKFRQRRRRTPGQERLYIPQVSNKRVETSPLWSQVSQSGECFARKYFEYFLASRFWSSPVVFESKRVAFESVSRERERSRRVMRGSSTLSLGSGSFGIGSGSVGVIRPRRYAFCGVWE